MEHQCVKAGSGPEENSTEARYILWWYAIAYILRDESSGQVKGMSIFAAIHQGNGCTDNPDLTLKDLLRPSLNDLGVSFSLLG